MYRFAATMLFLSITLMRVCGADDYHIFTDSQGRSVEAKIIAVDAQKNLVNLQLRSRKHVKVKPDIFTEKDQAYIRDWQIIKGFMSSSYLSVDTEKEVLDSREVRKRTDIIHKYEEVAYRLDLYNRNPFALENMKIEYRVFWEQELASGIDEENCIAGVFDTDTLDSRSKAVSQTTPVTLMEQHLTGGYTYINNAPDTLRSKMRGIWVRLQLTTPGGQTVMREFCSPKNLKEHQTWKPADELESKKPGVKQGGKKKKRKKKKKQ